ncbi:MAG: hypothetical protein IKF41_01715 [Alphaproteobacteria bacterium]|nr:hypothetical protein [Alphaproteobacteria bacterium]
MALSLKQKLFDYFAQRHFDLMTPEVRARFDDYAKNEDFQGHMKHWNDNYKGAVLPDLVYDTAANTNDHKLTDDEWEELYDAYQETLQNMDVEKIPSIGFDSDYKKATKDFIAKWFGSFADGKVFIPKEATAVATNILSPTTPTAALRPDDVLADFLEAHPEFKDIFKRNLKETFSDIGYKDFIQGLKDKKYNSDTKFRSKVLEVVGYIRDYGPRAGYQAPSRSVWPENVGYTSRDLGDGTFVVNDTPGTSPIKVLTDIYTNSDTDKWFEIPAANHAACIQRFKDHYTEIFDTLLTKSKVREHFLAQTNNSIIVKPLTEALKQTDYENKDSKDYLPAKYPDEKNWMQQFEDWKNDTYEDYLRKFTNPSRGTRIFFSPWSQNIIKAFDKVKIKPTDGLEGIFAKKDDIAKKLVTSKNSTDHFKWFTDTVEKLKDAGMGKAVEGALRNGAQMRHLVSGIIAEAVERGKEKEAKTALEILSVAKYGLSSSRTMDAINKTDMTIFSDGKLSWNKNEGIKMVTGAFDKTIKLGIQTAGYAATGAYNFIQHRRTKIGNDIRNNSVLKKAHDKWDERDKLKIVNDKLDKLARGEGKSHRIINDPATLASAEATLAGMAPGATGYDDLKADINDYKTASAERTGIQTRQADRAAHPENDKFRELISYWDMLESVGKSHSFTLGSMSVKRKAYLENFARGTSKAQDDFNAYLAQYDNLRTA